MTSLIPFIASALFAVPAAAGQNQPVGEHDPDAMDVARTPVTDLNIDRQKIPELLIRAQQNPYELTGLNRCSQLIAAVEEFDAMLGPDIDLPRETRDRISSGRLGKAVVGSFIPFRGVIRELSGANEQQLKVRAAVQAGIARRGFLKGVGHSRGCKYPARPATRANVDDWLAGRLAATQEQAQPKRGKDDIRYTSQPVVQQTD